ncbi:MAG: hypothetical protein INQ03_13830 [Candidatus Heimdallarchaeota archaeon]|nr:hypothetical protein [Candidatus Heimdallarchaeota archaeon]
MSQYEFTKQQDREILSFAQKLVLLTISFLFAGLIILILGLIPPTNSGNIATGAFFTALAVAMFLSIQYFHNIIVTEGNDLDELVKGIKAMSRGMDLVIVASLVMAATILYSYVTAL